jgi:hypothetical protein
MAETRSPVRRSEGRGTAVDRETVVDSNAASLLLKGWPESFLRMRSENVGIAASKGTPIAPDWDFIGNAVKKALRKLVWRVVAAYAPGGEKRVDAAASPAADR